MCLSKAEESMRDRRGNGRMEASLSDAHHASGGSGNGNCSSRPDNLTGQRFFMGPTGLGHGSRLEAQLSHPPWRSRPCWEGFALA